MALSEWVPYIRAAREPAEQNLEALIMEGHLFYRMIKEVERGDELFVWYTPELARAVGVPEVHPTFMKGSLCKTLLTLSSS